MAQIVKTTFSDGLSTKSFTKTQLAAIDARKNKFYHQNITFPTKWNVHIPGFGWIRGRVYLQKGVFEVQNIELDKPANDPPAPPVKKAASQTPVSISIIENAIATGVITRAGCFYNVSGQRFKGKKALIAGINANPKLLA